MSKDWEIINREEAAKILCKIADIYLEKICNLERECSCKLNAIANFFLQDQFYGKNEIIALGKCWNLSGIPDERYPETSITDAIRETANRLLDRETERLKIAISEKAAKEIFEKRSSKKGE